MTKKKHLVIKANKILCSRHVWTEIAPEFYSPGAKMWKWCIRCGSLKLGREVFSHGPKQRKTIVAD